MRHAPAKWAEGKTRSRIFPASPWSMDGWQVLNAGSAVCHGADRQTDRQTSDRYSNRQTDAIVVLPSQSSQPATVIPNLRLGSRWGFAFAPATHRLPACHGTHGSPSFGPGFPFRLRPNRTPVSAGPADGLSSTTVYLTTPHDHFKIFLSFSGAEAAVMAPRCLTSTDPTSQ